MGKYEPLTEFLRNQRAGEVRMSFEQIERVIGDKLPPVAQRHRAWWSNSPSNNVMTKAWLEAGFRSEQVDMSARKLVFRREQAERSISSQTITPGRHPLFGWMKGTVRIAPGVDLAQPADPDWAQRIDDEYPTSS
jgi:hypothetical protein